MNQIFKHYLNGVEINEPKGFDNFKIKLERTTHHGIEETDAINPDSGGIFRLEFFEKYPRELIMKALRENVEEEILYEHFYAPDSKTPLERIYYAYVDLVNVSVKYHPYCSVLCSLRRESEIINFYNRKNTTVDLRSQNEDLDGNPITGYRDERILIPSKAIRLTAENTQENGDEINIGTIDSTSMGGWAGGMFFAGFDNRKLNEIENTFSNFIAFTHRPDTPRFLLQNTSAETGLVSSLEIKLLFDFYLQDAASRTEYGYRISVITVQGMDDIHLIQRRELAIMREDERIFGRVDFEYNSKDDNRLDGIKIEDIVGVSCECYVETMFSGGWRTGVSVIASTENFIKIQVDTEKPHSFSNVILAHEALSKLSEISGAAGFSVKSDWYGRFDSSKNPLPNPSLMPIFGGGALKSLLSGFELRNAYLPDGETQPSVQVSFQDLYDSFNAIDNIGYGSEKDEDGKAFIRVERWQWFYNDEVILEINHPKIDDNVVNGNFWSRLKTGYSKHLEDTEFNAVDSFYGEQERTTGVGMESELNMVSGLIADPYLIELTRRQRFDENGNEVQTSRNWRYDNDNFVIALEHEFNEVPLSSVYRTDVGVENSDGTIISPETFTNFRISPMRNATRWAERFFEIGSHRNELKFTSGEGNKIAKGNPAERAAIPELRYFSYLQDPVNGVAMAENDAIPKIEPFLMDDILAFDFPIKYKQYLAIRKNPHGIIRVNGIDYYLKSFEYCFRVPLGRFQVIRKA